MILGMLSVMELPWPVPCGFVAYDIIFYSPHDSPPCHIDHAGYSTGPPMIACMLLSYVIGIMTPGHIASVQQTRVLLGVSVRYNYDTPMTHPRNKQAFCVIVVARLQQTSVLVLLLNQDLVTVYVRTLVVLAEFAESS